MNKELVKESISQFEVAIDNLKQSLLEEDKPKELEVGKWCWVDKGDCDNPNAVDALIFYEGKDRSYGLNHAGEWSIKYLTSKCSYFFKDYKRQATPQEVEEALTKEAKRRGYRIGTVCLFGNTKDKRIIRDNEFTYGEWQDTMALCLGMNVIFDQRSGKWASIIEQDKFAELKEAHKNGAVIEVSGDEVEWLVCENPIWNPCFEYRIKPEEKHKVGDVVEVVICGEQYSFITRIETISFENGIVDTVNGWHVNSCKKLTQQQVIDFLYTNNQ